MDILDRYKQTALDISVTAQAAFGNWAALDGGQLPADPLDAMQVELCRWQRRNFGDVSPVNKIDIHMGMGIVEEFAEEHDAAQLKGDKGKLDGLGDICVYAGQLLIANRMALRPLMFFADLMANDWVGDPDANTDPLSVAGKFCHVLLKRDQRIRGYDKSEVWVPALVSHLSAIMALAKLDILNSECEDGKIGDEGEMDEDHLIQNTYLAVGGSVVLKRNWSTNRLTGGSK
jgi:hypothetical protein